MKLAGGGDGVGPVTRSALHSAFGAVAGARAYGVNVIGEEDGMRRLSVFVEGWSPSLHAVEINYVAEVPLDRWGAVDPEEALAAFADAVAEQGRRAERALSMGRALPLPTNDDPVTGGDGPHVGHLLLDRALPVLAALDGDDLATSLVNGVMDLHAQPQDSNGGPTLADEMTSVTEEADGRMVLRRIVAVDTVPGTPCTFDGGELLIGGGRDVPDTVMALLPGRRVRDVMAIHPSIDDRIIVEAGRDDHGGISLRVEPDLIEAGAVMEAASTD